MNQQQADNQGGFLRKAKAMLGGSSKKKILVKQQDLSDCGAACIASVLAWYGLKYPIARIRQFASTDKQGTTILGIVEAAEKLSLSAKAIKGEPDSLFEIPLPAIAHVVLPNGLHHYVVIYEANKKFVRAMDPASGTIQSLPTETFQDVWTGILVLLAPLPEFEAGDQTASAFTRFWQLLQPHKGILLQVLIGAMFYTVLGLATSIYLQKIIDNIIPDGNQNLLNVLSIIMIGILLVQLFINYTRTLLTVRTGQLIDARLILGYYKHLLRLPQQFFDNMRTGEIISRMNDAVKIRTFVNEALVTFAVNIFILVFAFALMFTAYWKLALIMIVVIPLYAIIYGISDRLNSKTQRRMMEDNADLGAQLVESVNSVSTIKQFSLEEYANVKTENRFVKLLGSIYKSSTNSLVVGTASDFVSGLFVILLLWAGATFVLNRALTPGELLSFYALMGYFTGPVLSLIGLNKTTQDALIAFDRLFEIMDLEKESFENKMELEKEMMGDIVLKDVSFRYGTRANVFENLNLKLQSGKVTAVIGESGSGKTTLLALLQNLYPLTGGSISIGGYDLKYLTPSSLRAHVSVVPQKVDLFAGTVRENIAAGEFEPDMKKIISVCKRIGVMTMIEELPNGFDTMLGENGVNLSGGQRQRLAIARALYRDPEVLILDEATSSLDSHSEQKIQEALQLMQKEGKTIIIIAHRLSTVMFADNIVVLHKGELAEEGNHHDLMHAKGPYYQLWERQFPMMKEMNGSKKTKSPNYT
ncbi:MAG: peptidase domain-containing ABC transporter [Flavitalea sp.]